MIKALFKLLAIILILYLLLQIPFIKEQADNLKAAIFEKKDNVTREIERVRGEVDDVRNRVNEIKEKAANFKEGVEEVTEKAIQTKEALEDAASKVSEALETFRGDAEEAPTETPPEVEPATP